MRTLRPPEKLEQLTHEHVSLEHIGALRDALEKTLVRCQQMTDTRFISVEKRTDIRMGLDFFMHKDVVDAVLGRQTRQD